MNRGARHQPIFLDDRDRGGFLRLLGDLSRDDGIETHAYCLMGNHYHLVLFCPEGNLSVGMRHLGASYAQRFNRLHGFDGPLFRGRFLSKPIETDDYLLQASRYVHRNPLDIDSTAHLAAYPWSSYAAYLGHRRPPRWLHRRMVLDLVGGDAARYRSYVEAIEPGDLPSLEALEAAVSAATGRVAPSLLTGRGCRTIVRNITLTLAIDEGWATTDDLADHFGMTGVSSVWSAVHRTRDRMASEPALADVIDICRLGSTRPRRNEQPGA